MAPEALKAKLARIDALRRTEDLDDAVAGLRKALTDRSNLVIAKAAAIAGSRYIGTVIPDLLAAYERLFGEEAAVVDPLVLGKQAIAQALKDLDYLDPAPFLRGLGHVQLEKIWGGSEDRAGRLRATCATALVACTIDGRALLDVLIDHLVDPDKEVRLEVARAIAGNGGHESVLLLRLKVLTGDRDAEVLGACFAALLEREPRESVAFVARFLTVDQPERMLEAASALAESRVAEALAVVRDLWATDIPPDLRRAIIFSCGASPLAAAAEFLLSIVDDRRADLVVAALAALGTSRFRNDVRQRAHAAASRSGDPRVTAAYAQAFPADGSDG